MPLAMQTRLLRVMEDRAVRPVGGNRETPVDVRIIAATNRDLSAEVEQGNFREDLYYRLNVLSIRMPALRERIQDLPELIEHFATSIATDLGVPVPKLEESELKRLAQYDWPGNIRELKNVTERCLLLNHQPSQSLTSGTPESPCPLGQDADGDLTPKASRSDTSCAYSTWNPATSRPPPGSRRFAQNPGAQMPGLGVARREAAWLARSGLIATPSRAAQLSRPNTERQRHVRALAR